jgi:hypothetical protein
MNLARNLYDRDFYAWTKEQMGFLQHKQFERLDIDNLAEEIDSMGKSEKRTLSSRLEILLIHLLKWKFQPNLQSRSWSLTIKEQRRRLARHLSENPSLRTKLEEEVIEAYDIAIYEAAKETGFNEDFFPVQCEWTAEQLLDVNFLPDSK